MSILKRGKCDTSVVSSSTVYVCNDCGYTEMDDSSGRSKKCSKCNTTMVRVSASTSASSSCGCSGGSCSI